MEGQEEVAVMGSNGHTQIVKGKRTKRQRPLSPFDLALTSSSSSVGLAGSGNTSDYASISSPSAGTNCEVDVYESTEEEEDMANCLILLAKGVGTRQSPELATTTTTATTATTTTKSGFYIYECKTCNRAFPSFQALGGHRASHKKPKPMIEEKKAAPTATPPSTEYVEEAQINIRNNCTTSSPPKHVQIGAAPNKGLINTNNNNKTKIHECSICGLEFMSGQALGGHMRRHRSAVAASPSQMVTMGVETTISTTLESKHVEIKPRRNILSLDLNLPAPEDDSKFQFTSAAAQQSLVFSASALVDCHY
ncbi:zinc finger protein ZAT5-like [Quercus lobata]|uniref:C2H2-type domain-containing protein n=1 Tax=Quercus lobata TaxID=97700 RepID=A0A7N2KMM8_QUELO|nr:zinc finger protein ZAT5-like [Quercus lobata]